MHTSRLQKFADLFLAIGIVFQKMLKNGDTFQRKAIFGMLLAKADVFLEIKLLEMSIGNVALAFVLKGAVKAAAPGQILMIDYKYGQISFFHKILRR